jgi:hypothetical protein
MNAFVSRLMVLMYGCWCFTPPYSILLHSHPGGSRPHIHAYGLIVELPSRVDSSNSTESIDPPAISLKSSENKLYDYYRADGRQDRPGRLRDHGAILGYLNSPFVRAPVASPVRPPNPGYADSQRAEPRSGPAVPSFQRRDDRHLHVNLQQFVSAQGMPRLGANFRLQFIAPFLSPQIHFQELISLLRLRGPPLPFIS